MYYWFQRQKSSISYIPCAHTIFTSEESYATARFMVSSIISSYVLPKIMELFLDFLTSLSSKEYVRKSVKNSF